MIGYGLVTLGERPPARLPRAALSAGSIEAEDKMHDSPLLTSLWMLAGGLAIGLGVGWALNNMAGLLAVFTTLP